MPASTVTPQITSAASWQKQDQVQGLVTELPSGKIVMLLRKLDLPVMLKSGRIPNPLASIITEMIGKGEQTLPMDKMEDPQVFEQMMTMVDTCVSSSMVEPKAILSPVKGKHPRSGIRFPESDEAFQKRWDEYEDVLNDPLANTISTDWISIEDKIFIFFFSQGGAADLATFRSATGDAMAALSGSQAVELPSQ